MSPRSDFAAFTAQRKKDFFSKCDQIRRRVTKSAGKCGFGHIY